MTTRLSAIAFASDIASLTENFTGRNGCLMTAIGG